MSDPELAIMQLTHLARWCMAQKGMPALVIAAPEDGDDLWRLYPVGYAAIGKGRTLPSAIDDAMNQPQVPPIGSPLV